MWVLSSSLADSDSRFSKRSQFDVSASSTARAHPFIGQDTHRYTDGLCVSGPVLTDNGQTFFTLVIPDPNEDCAIVTIAGVPVDSQQFTSVTAVETGSRGDQHHYVRLPQWDGILGLAPFEFRGPLRSASLRPAMQKEPSFLYSVYKQSMGKINSFGIHVSKRGMELYFGGGDEHLYEGGIEIHAADQYVDYWIISDASARIVSGASEESSSGFETLIDSGAKLIYGPPDVVRPASFIESMFP